jgi:hypothetical protein
MTCDFVLHIGANKTGSSAIQSFIRLNLGVLQRAGYLVARDFLSLFFERIRVRRLRSVLNCWL